MAELNLNRLDWYVLGYLLQYANAADIEITNQEIPPFRLGLGSTDYPSDEQLSTSIADLRSWGLIRTVFDDVAYERLGRDGYPEITPKGVVYLLAHQLEYFEQIHGLLWEFPVDCSNTINELNSLGDEDGMHPASDRYVKINHNSHEYTQADAALAKLEEELARTNQYSDASERDAHISELQAGRSILKQDLVSLRVIVSLLGRLLSKLVAKFSDHAISTLAAKAWELVKGLFQ